MAFARSHPNEQLSFKDALQVDHQQVRNGILTLFAHLTRIYQLLSITRHFCIVPQLLHFTASSAPKAGSSGCDQQFLWFRHIVLFRIFDRVTRHFLRPGQGIAYRLLNTNLACHALGSISSVSSAHREQAFTSAHTFLISPTF